MALDEDYGVSLEHQVVSWAYKRNIEERGHPHGNPVDDTIHLTSQQCQYPNGPILLWDNVGTVAVWITGAQKTFADWIRNGHSRAEECPFA